MFSVKQKRQIADAVQQILRETNHPELPAGEINFHLHVDGAESWSWADIKNNGAVTNPGVNPWNETHTIAFNIQGLNWPPTLGDFTLVGPADNAGAWRWYERHHDGTTERIRVDHQLQPLGSPHHQ